MGKRALYPTPLFRFEGKLLTKQLPGRSKALFLALSYHLMELEIALDRIDQHAEVLSDQQSEPVVTTSGLLLMADVHSYVVAWTNVGRCLERLSRILKDRVLSRILSKRERWFSRMRQARNSLEHLDERVARVTGPDHTPEILYVPGKSAATAVILGVRIEVRRRGQDRLHSLLEELDLWLDSRPEKS